MTGVVVNCACKGAGYIFQVSAVQYVNFGPVKGMMFIPTLLDCMLYNAELWYSSYVLPQLKF